MNGPKLTLALSEVKQWLKTQPHMPKCASEDEEVLEAFINGFSPFLSLTMLKLDAYYTFRGQFKQPYFHDRDPKKIKWYSVISKIILRKKKTQSGVSFGFNWKRKKGGEKMRKAHRKYIMLEETTPGGDHVLLAIPPKCQISYYSADESRKLMLMLFDSHIRQHRGHKTSLYLLVDAANLTQELVDKHSDHSSTFNLILEVYPVKIKAVVWFNTDKDKVELYDQFLKEFCSEASLTKNHLETGSESLAKHLPLQMLPDDYDQGKNLPVKALWDGVQQRLERERDWFVTAGSQFTQEMLRP